MVQEASAIMADFHPGGMRALLNANAHADYRDVLPTIAVPTLLLYGTDDVRVAAERGPRDEPADPWLDAGDDSRRRAHGGRRSAGAFNAEVRRFLHGTLPRG